MIPDWLWPCCTFILENDEERAIRRKNDEINRDLRRDKKDHRRQENFQKSKIYLSLKITLFTNLHTTIVKLEVSWENVSLRDKN